MSYQNNMDSLRSLRLSAFAEQYAKDQNDPQIHQMTFDERLSVYLSAQISHRKVKRYELKLRQSKIKMTTACRESIIYDAPRSLERSVLEPLMSCEWVKYHRNILIVGPAGLGKTHLESALGVEAIGKDYKVLYTRLPRLLEDLVSANAEGTLRKLRNRIAKFRVLLLDDWGISRMSVEKREHLFEIFEDKVERGSLIITSPLPIKKWHEYLGGSSHADAMLDRIVHNAYTIELTGESMRKFKARGGEL